MLPHFFFSSRRRHTRCSRDWSSDVCSSDLRINLSFVLGNKVMVGTVNANREYFETGVKDLSQAALEYPGWLNRLLTHPVKGLENYMQLFEYLEHGQGVIKVFCEVAED